jgi:hypothetical protein
LGKTITTDSPRWSPEEEEQFAEKLLLLLTSDYEGFGLGENLMKMASNFRRRPGSQPPKRKQELEEIDKETEARAQEGLDGNVFHGRPEIMPTPVENEFNEEDIEGSPIAIRLTDDDGHTHAFKLTLGQQRESEFFTLRNHGIAQHEIEVNLAHPILDSVDSTDTDIRKVIQYVTLALGVAEIFADSEDGVILRRKFNNSLDSIGQLSNTDEV